MKKHKRGRNASGDLLRGAISIVLGSENPVKMNLEYEIKEFEKAAGIDEGIGIRRRGNMRWIGECFRAAEYLSQLHRQGLAANLRDIATKLDALERPKDEAGQVEDAHGPIL